MHNFLSQELPGILGQEEASDSPGGYENLCKLQAIPGELLRLSQEAGGVTTMALVVECLTSRWLLSTAHYDLIFVEG